jgi:hypothetical protein
LGLIRLRRSNTTHVALAAATAAASTYLIGLRIRWWLLTSSFKTFYSRALTLNRQNKTNILTNQEQPTPELRTENFSGRPVLKSLVPERSSGKF